MLLRVVYIIAGLFLAANAVYITFRLIASGSTLTLALTAAPLMAGLALGVLLVIKNVKPEKAKDPEEDSST